MHVLPLGLIRQFAVHSHRESKENNKNKSAASVRHTVGWNQYCSSRLSGTLERTQLNYLLSQVGSFVNPKIYVCNVCLT